MSRVTNAEDLLQKITDLEGIDDNKALTLVNDYMKSSKKKTWSKSMDELMKKFIDIIIDQNQIKYFKEALTFCRSLTQANYIKQFEGIVKSAKDLLLEKHKASSEKYKDFKISNRSLIEEEKEGEFNEEYFSDSPNAIDEELFLTEQKFIWEAYKTLLDLTKTNSKLFNLYAQILKDCFTFCGENQRNHEFKALCDSVRNHLYTLKKNENKPNFANKIQISDPSVLKILIQTSINQIETANKLEEWEESFKTSEKIVSFIEEYEKFPSKSQNQNNKKTLKIPPLFEIELYNHIQKLLWVANYPLYHSYAMMAIKDILENNKTKMENLNDKEKEKLNMFNLEKINEKMILAFLATPIKNAYTNFTKIGEELFEENNDTEIKTCQKMMKILKVNHVPSRKYLFGYLLNNKVVSNSASDIKELFEIFEFEKNPIILAKKAVKYILKIFNNEKENEYTPYLKKIQENLITKVLMFMPSIYKNISLTRFINLFKDLKIEPYEITDIISESSRNNLFKCKINIKNDLVEFITNESSQEKFNSLIEEFLKNSKKVLKDIIKNKNVNKINILKEKIYDEIRNNNTKSLETTNNLMEETKKQNKKLKSFINKRDKIKTELKLKTAETKEMTKRKLLEKELLEKEELKDLQKKKEYEIEIKRRVIDLLRKYTNSIVLKEGKRIKLDDLLKDLNKITEEEIIKALTDQENESLLKKEKELKKETKKKDYTLREFRKRDFEKYTEESKKKWEESNKRHEEEDKQFFDNNIEIRDLVLKYKPYKDEYVKEVEKKNEEKYQKEVKEYNEYLERNLTKDISEELDKFFVKYFEEFTKKEQDEKEQKKALEIWVPKIGDSKNKQDIGRGSNYTETKTTKKPAETKEFERSKRANENKEIEKERNKDNEFQRGAKFESNKKDNEFQRGAKFESNKKDNDGFQRGANFESNKKEKEGKKDDDNWRKGGKKEDKKEEKKDEDNWRKGGKKEDKKEEKKDEDNWRKVGKKEDKKEEKKDEDNWRKGGKKEDKKDDWGRGAKAETKKEDKKDDWGRGAKAETKKDDWGRGAKAETKKDDKKDDWGRGTKTETKKDDKKDDWGRGAKAETKKEDKKDDWGRGTKAETKKDDKKDDWGRGTKAEPKKEEKKKKKKK